MKKLKKPPVLESTVKKEVKKRLKKLGVYAFWPVQFGLGTTTLDCLGCYKGVFFAIETKAPGRNLTPVQQMTVEKIRETHGLVFVIDGTADYPYTQIDRLTEIATYSGPAYRFDSFAVADNPDASRFWHNLCRPAP